MVKYPQDLDIKYCPCCSSSDVKLIQLDNGNSVGIDCTNCDFYSSVQIINDDD